MDTLVCQYGEELRSCIVNRETGKFQRKLMEISLKQNKSMVTSLFTWVDNSVHRDTLLMNAIEVNNVEIFDILMANKVCKIPDVSNVCIIYALPIVLILVLMYAVTINNRCSGNAFSKCNVTLHYICL